MKIYVYVTSCEKDSMWNNAFHFIREGGIGFFHYNKLGQYIIYHKNVLYVLHYRANI